jgi:hypothetical protein
MGKLLNEIKKLEKSLIKIFSQSNYIKRIINKYGYNDLKVRKTLIKIDLRLVKSKK